MQYVKNGEGEIRAVIDRFSGLDCTGPLCRESSFEIRNLRLLPDGSLQRRGGVVSLLQLPDEIRGAVGIHRDGADESYLVAGETVYYLMPKEEGYQPRALGSLTTSSGDVAFFHLGGILVLMDGTDIWSVTPTGIEPLETYIPLYGKDWNESNDPVNETYERPNLLTRRLRVRYRLSGQYTMVNVQALSPASCDRVLIDGEEVGGFSYAKESGVLLFGQKYPAGSVAEVFVTMPEDFMPQHSLIRRARRMASVGDPMAERVMLYDLPDDDRVWISRTAPKQDRDLLKRLFPGCLMIYLNEDDEYTVGKGNTDVMGVCYHYDRTLVFTPGETWMADGTENENGKLRMIPINSREGCTSRKGVDMLGNNPLSVCGRRLLLWDGDTDERDECNARTISAPIETLLSASFGTKGAIYVNAPRNEVWCYVPGERSRVLIWQADSRSWTSFDGFVVDHLCDLSGRVGICHGSTLYCLDEKADADTDEKGHRHAIIAEYLSSFFDFGEPGAVKHVHSAEVTAQCPSGDLTLILEGVSGKKWTVRLRGGKDGISQHHSRVNMGRFRFLRVGFCADGRGDVRVFGLRVAARR